MFLIDFENGGGVFKLVDKKILCGSSITLSCTKCKPTITFHIAVYKESNGTMAMPP